MESDQRLFAEQGRDPRTNTAMDVARGIARMFHRLSLVALIEVPLPNGRRADMVAIDPRGQIIIVEIKVAKSDLLLDKKWPEYLEWCDQFYWALPPSLDPSHIDSGPAQSSRCGLIIADRYDASIVKEAAIVSLAPARRRSELLRVGRLAMRRMMVSQDPDLLSHVSRNDIGV